MNRGAPAENQPAILELRDGHKRYGGTSALRGVSFSVRPGEIHALVGENGAGKSTLVGILSGVVEPDSGDVLLDGRPVRFTAPLEARRNGIHLVHQELALLPQSTVVENVFLGAELASRWGFLDWSEMRRRTADVLSSLGARVDPERRVGSLSVAERQMVEIARALIADSRVLMFDEPTAPLSPLETERLFHVLRRLREEGKAIVYISHRLEEVLAIADRVTVLKDGDLVGCWPATGLTIDDLIRRMVGRPIEDLFPEHDRSVPERAPLLEVTELVDPPRVLGVSFSVRPGEIVGLAGLEGHGQDEVLACLAGERSPVRGRLQVDGRSVAWGSPVRMFTHGIGFVPEDRKTKGLILERSTQWNVTLPSLRSLSVLGWLRTSAERAFAERAVRIVDVRGELDAPVQALSGGNQQKVVLAKWLATHSRILLLNQPTRGVDVGAKAEIYALLRSFADSGGAVLLTSRELVEILGLCDRVLVMRRGRVAGELPRTATEEQVMAVAAAGEAA
jgi:ABC-type sugar transport system ATPase subunit